MSFSLWQGSRRYDFVDMAPSSARLIFPTSSRDGGQDYPRLELTYSGDCVDDYADTCPAIPALGAIPPFKDGKLHIAGLAMGGSSLSLDLGTTVGFPPNPNRKGGNDPAQLTGTTRTINMTLNQVAKTYLDLRSLAGYQNYYGIQALYGLYPGNFIGFVATDARFNFPQTDAGGDFFTTTGDAYVDGADKTISLVFPY
jgi:hypothetical protein